MAAPNYGVNDNSYDTGTQPTKAALPNYKKVATAPDGVPVYQDGSGNYYTQNADQTYTQQFQGGAPDWLTGKAPAAPTGPWGTAGNLNGWIDQQLKGVSSTDDPNYWYGKLAADPKAAGGDASALGYWTDRIQRGNGSALVKNGTLSLFNDGPAGPAAPNNTGITGDPRTMVENHQYDDLYNTLLARSNQSLAVNPNDPTIRAQADPYAAATTKSTRNYLADLAEKAGPLANLTGETRLANENAGQAQGQFESQLIGNELTARRTEIQNALTQMGGMLSDQQKNALTAQLAQLDDATKRYGIDKQTGLGYANLAQVGSQFDQSLAERLKEFTGTQQFNYANMDETTKRLLLQLLGTS